MNKGISFHKRYGWALLLLLVTEVAIALFSIHKFIRGFLGDVLVIPLLYCLIRWVSKVSVQKTIGRVLLLAITLEVAQSTTLLNPLTELHPVLKTLLGSTFDPLDIVAYLLGATLILYIEKHYGNT